MAELTEPVQGIYLFPGRDLVGASEIDYVVTPFLPVYDQVRADLGLQEQDATYLEGLQERLHSTPHPIIVTVPTIRVHDHPDGDMTYWNLTVQKITEANPQGPRLLVKTIGGGILPTGINGSYESCWGELAHFVEQHIRPSSINVYGAYLGKGVNHANRQLSRRFTDEVKCTILETLCAKWAWPEN